MVVFTLIWRLLTIDCLQIENITPLSTVMFNRFTEIIFKYLYTMRIAILRPIILSSILAGTLFSCVPARKFEELQAKQKKCEQEGAQLKTSNQGLETQVNEMKVQIEGIGKQIIGLQNDTTILGTSIRLKASQYGQLSANYENLIAQNKQFLAGSASENKKLIGQLQATQEDLIKKQDELKVLENELNGKKQNLDELKTELQKREARVNELESVLKKKDEAVEDLKRKVSAALLGFENKGLTITQKNGKIYVSLDESLLFASGSTAVEAKGVEALKKLAKVLEQNEDINIMVEGHTDDVPMKGVGEIKDNWDLSVIRATSIVKILVNNSKTDPRRLTAAGRGEYMPIDVTKTPEGRKKNRRTEIILAPKLDELLKILETN